MTYLDVNTYKEINNNSYNNYTLLILLSRKMNWKPNLWWIYRNCRKSLSRCRFLRENKYLFLCKKEQTSFQRKKIRIKLLEITSEREICHDIKTEYKKMIYSWQHIRYSIGWKSSIQKKVTVYNFIQICQVFGNGCQVE